MSVTAHIAAILFYIQNSGAFISLEKYSGLIGAVDIKFQKYLFVCSKLDKR